LKFSEDRLFAGERDMLKRIYDFFAEDRRHRIIGLALAAVGLGFTIYQTTSTPRSSVPASDNGSRAASPPVAPSSSAQDLATRPAAAAPQSTTVQSSVTITQTTSGANSPAIVASQVELGRTHSPKASP
jgi:hypothetical protein